MHKTWEVSVSNAAPSIKEALLLNANVSAYHCSKSTGERMLVHNAALRPTKELPWPLSKVQPHDVEFTCSGSPTYSDGSDRYSKEYIDDAIETFLWGLSSHDLIRITVS